jgi:hypothetical protein
MPLILGANSLTGGYEVDNSLRFNSGSSDTLTRTFASTGNRQIWTLSFWVKRSGALNARNSIINSLLDGGNYTEIFFAPDNTFQIDSYISSRQYRLITTQVFRDPSAWYHIVIALDTTQATSSNRVKMYVNGSQVTAFTTETYPTQNTNGYFNQNRLHTIGVNTFDTSGFLNGYLSEFNFIDGQQLDPTDFGEFDEDSGIWKPIAYTGTYGTNGFYLEFQDSGALGTDSSGNGNTFTVNNLTSIDQTTDTPTNNFATINALENSYSGLTLSEGNLKGVTTNPYFSFVRSTIGVSKGKWYMEAKCTAQSASENKWQFGISDAPPTSSSSYLGNFSFSYGWRGEGNTVFFNGTSASYGTEGGMSTGMIVGIALDLDNNKIYWSRNGTWKNSANPATNTNGFSITGASSTNTGFYHFAFGELDGDYNYTYETNFGNPSFTISSGNSDENGIGNFEYSVPSGYLSLCTANLATDG